MPELSITDLQDKREELRLLRRRKEMKDANGLAFYRPHAKQELFHGAAECKGRYARTGNRFGKSEMGATEDCAWAIGERPWYPKGDPRRTIGIPTIPTKGLIVCQDWDKVTEIFTSIEKGERAGKILRFLPKASIVGRPHRNHSGHIDRITVESIHGGESVIMFDTVKSFKVNPLGSESSDWDWVHIDEPIPIAMWRAISRGLVDRDGHYWFTCTPLCEMWINDHFIPPHLLRSELVKPLLSQQGEKWVMTGGMRDNPFLTEKAIASFERELPEDEKACRMDGIPTALSGVVYKEYNPTKHLYLETPHDWDSPTEPPLDYTIRISIDPHPKTPHAVLFAATSPLGQTFIFHEIFSQIKICDLCSIMTEVLNGRIPVRVVCDPCAWINNPMTGLTMADEFYRCGFSVEKASKELSYGILKTKEALDLDDNLYFNTSCTRTKYEFDHYTWKPDSSVDKPIDKDDHMMECLYRLVLIGLTYQSLSEAPISPKPTNLRNLTIPHINTSRALRGQRTPKEIKHSGLKGSRYRR